MSHPIDVGSVDEVALTVLVDNKADLIVKSTEEIRYFTEKPLLAEHGFSVLIQLDNSKEKILWDAGVSKVALMENMRRMKVDFGSISKIALSHGHSDHYTAMTNLIKELDKLPKSKTWGESAAFGEIEDWLEEARIPLVAHPAAFRERWRKKDDGAMVGPYLPPPEQEWRAAGAKLVLSEQPYQLAPGCWTTGFVPRNSFEESGRSSSSYYRVDSDFLPDDLEDDQAIVINVRDKGLIVLSGCAHSGIVNTVNYARDFTGVETVYAVLGGFHLARTGEDEIDQTIKAIKSIGPKLVCASHCTGFRAIGRFAHEMPDAFVEGVVGTTYLF
jgi:7,8-dihydropterin-6-yl-methyl-4-(beta-D-ribofuranosyl)aminobenzene 5'-phosphate synthase